VEFEFYRSFQLGRLEYGLKFLFFEIPKIVGSGSKIRNDLVILSFDEFPSLLSCYPYLILWDSFFEIPKFINYFFYLKI
jgi:hypothetical protein